MKVLVATEKPFAKVAVDGIRKEIEAAGFELALLEKYTDKAQLLDAVKDANAIIIRSDIIDAEVLDAAKELKIVGRTSSGSRFIHYPDQVEVHLFNLSLIYRNVRNNKLYRIVFCMKSRNEPTIDIDGNRLRHVSTLNTQRGTNPNFTFCSRNNPFFNVFIPNTYFYNGRRQQIIYRFIVIAARK